MLGILNAKKNLVISKQCPRSQQTALDILKEAHQPQRLVWNDIKPPRQPRTIRRTIRTQQKSYFSWGSRVRWSSKKKHWQVRSWTYPLSVLERSTTLITTRKNINQSNEPEWREVGRQQEEDCVQASAKRIRPQPLPIHLLYLSESCKQNGKKKGQRGRQQSVEELPEEGSFLHVANIIKTYSLYSIVLAYTITSVNFTEACIGNELELQ